MTSTTKKTCGATLAMAAAGMLGMSVASVSVAEEALVQCFGGTSCAGQNDCKTADNACKGQASCKGHGFKMMTEFDCSAAGGTFTKL